MSQRSTPDEDVRPSDTPLLDVLRASGPHGVGDLARALDVTPTAIRQRLARLEQAGIVARTTGTAAVAARGRGRPSHSFALSEKGRRLGGENYRDLALVLWNEVRATADPAVRRGLLGRIGAGLASLVDAEVEGTSPEERLASAADLLRRRRVAVEFRDGAAEPAGHDGRPGPSSLISHSCPYPGLAETDRGICAAERVMIEEVVGAPVRLAECRLDGDACCRFTLVPLHATAATPG